MHKRYKKFSVYLLVQDILWPQIYTTVAIKTKYNLSNIIVINLQSDSVK